MIVKAIYHAENLDGSDRLCDCQFDTEEKVAFVEFLSPAKWQEVILPNGFHLSDVEFKQACP